MSTIHKYYKICDTCGKSFLTEKWKQNNCNCNNDYIPVDSSKEKNLELFYKMNLQLVEKRGKSQKN